MDKLRKKIIKYFLICLFGIYVVTETSDNLFEKYMTKFIYPKIAQQTADAEAFTVLSLALYTILSV